MKNSIFALLKKDLGLMITGKFFLLALGSLILYSCYINFVYVNMDQDSFPVCLYDPDQSLENVPSYVTRVSTREKLKDLCQDRYTVGLDVSGQEPEVFLLSSGMEGLDNCRAAYALSWVLNSPAQWNDTKAEVIGTNNKEMKNRREMTAECLFFELAAVGFLGLAAMLFKEKQMGAIRVHAILPLNQNVFILSKLGLLSLSDLAFAALLTLMNLGPSQGAAVLPGVLVNAGFLSTLMALVGFLCAVALPDFKQFSLVYLVLAVFITTPVFLAGQTGLSPGWIKFHPMYYLFSALKHAYFQEKSLTPAYCVCCIGAAALLFLAARRALCREMTKEG